MLDQQMMDKAEWDQIERAVEAEVRAACDRALAQPEPDRSLATWHVFFDGDNLQLIGGAQADGFAFKPIRCHVPSRCAAQSADAEAHWKRNPRESALVDLAKMSAEGGVHGARRTCG
jgi:hypothetical protein